MQIEIRKAVLPDELRSLLLFDRKVFPQDYFGPEEWQRYKSYWLLLGRRKIGCCAFEANVDFTEDLRLPNPRRTGSLYISTTGILPAYQGIGFGRLLKAWQIAYARHQGFIRVVTNTRKSNKSMITLNKSFGFRAMRTTPGYYSDPSEATVVMELLLPR